MAYCKPADVRLHIDTEMEPGEIEDLIVLADEDLDIRLGSHTLTDDLKKSCSALLTAVMIADKQPKTYGAGTVRISHGEARVTRWLNKVEVIVAQATSSRGAVVKSSAYRKIDENRRYPS